MRVDFFFGIGSRYSYLAATQLPRVEAEAGAVFRWRTVFSPDLIERAGGDPFDRDRARGQYRPGYRAQDAVRWAPVLGVP